MDNLFLPLTFFHHRRQQICPSLLPPLPCPQPQQLLFQKISDFFLFPPPSFFLYSTLWLQGKGQEKEGGGGGGGEKRLKLWPLSRNEIASSTFRLTTSFSLAAAHFRSNFLSHPPKNHDPHVTFPILPPPHRTRLP